MRILISILLISSLFADTISLSVEHGPFYTEDKVLDNAVYVGYDFPNVIFKLGNKAFIYFVNMENVKKISNIDNLEIDYMDDIYVLNPDYINETQHTWIDYLNPKVDAPIFMNVFNDESVDENKKEQEYFSKITTDQKVDILNNQMSKSGKHIKRGASMMATGAMLSVISSLYASRNTLDSKTLIFIGTLAVGLNIGGIVELIKAGDALSARNPNQR